MQIAAITLYPLQLRLKSPFKTAHDVTYERPLILVAVTTTDGITGFGDIQSFIDHAYAPESQAESLAEVQRLSHLILGQTFDSATTLSNWLQTQSQFSFAKAALEMAAWDIQGKQQGQSLQQMIGGVGATVPVGIAIGIQTDAQATQRAIAAAVAQGYQRIKLKLAVATDLQQLQTVLAAFSDQLFSVDANAGWQPAMMDRLWALEQAGVFMIEQPFATDAWQAHQIAQQQLTQLHISLDESLNDLADITRGLAIADAFTLKQAKLGGIWPTLQAIHQISVVDKIPWIGGMLSSGVGRAVDLALASLPATRQVPADSSSASRYFERDIVLAQPEIMAGQLPVPSAPGLGVTIDWSAVADLQVADTIQIK